MSFKLIGANSDLNSLTGQMNENILELKNRESTEIFKDDTGTRRVLLGRGKDGFYGLKVSQPTFDVYDASNDELIFNSDNNTFKIIESGTYTLTRPASTSTITESIPHGYSFIPTLMYNSEPHTTEPGVWRVGQTARNNLTSGALISVGTAHIDATNINFRAIAPTAEAEYASESVYNFKYYLLQETSN